MGGPQQNHKNTVPVYKDGSSVPAHTPPPGSPPVYTNSASPSLPPIKHEAPVWKPHEISTEKMRGLLDLRDAALADGAKFSDVVKAVSSLSDSEKRAVWVYKDAANQTFFSRFEQNHANQLAGACVNVAVANQLNGVFSDLKRGLIDSGYALNQALSKVESSTTSDSYTVRWNFDVLSAGQGIKPLRELMPSRSIHSTEPPSGIGAPGFSVLTKQ